jgi:hypothetical protein
MLVSCLAYSSTLKMEATYTSETSVYFQRTTWRYIAEDRALLMQFITFFDAISLIFKASFNNTGKEVTMKN